MLAVTEENVLIGVDAGCKEDVIRLLTELLVKSGCVTPEYYDVLIKREEEYPTGLPTEGAKVAIPHGFSEGSVIKPALAIATLKRPVVFRNMVSRDEEIPVEIVFLFALADAEEGGEDLHRVMGIFSDGGLLAALRDARSGSEVTGIMEKLLREAP
ncbi:MAG: PTS sugar transporter subunit IIA [Treponema sp.]|jgi:PTS system galactitol-specific IIA component|nr:PTS sugar transporter subunit IIA [Treponema sp.]